MTRTQSEDNMTSGWKTVKLGELGTIVGGATPSTRKHENYDNGTIAWITPKDLSNHNERFISRGERNITETGLKGCSAQLMPKHSVLFSSRAPIGYVAIAANELCTNQGFKSIVPNSKTDYLFLYYLLRYNKNKIEHLGSGTTFKEVSGSVMRNIEVRVPPLDVQRRIAAVLKPLDDKIELNARINARLERAAQALFKRHFVRFEPYGGTMPPGWRVGTLSEIAEYLNGLAMQKFRPKEGEVGVPVLKIKELRQGVCDESSELCSPSIKREYLVHDGDVIFSWSGTLLVDFWCGGECGLNQHLFKVTSSKYDKWFYYVWTKHHLRKFIAMAADMATTMGHIKREALDNSEVLIPTQEDYAEIGSLMSPLFDMIIENRKQSRTLARLRDVLLPRLMSGAVDVRQVRLNTMQEGGSR